MVGKHVRLHAAPRSCKQYNTMILITGFKPSKISKIMGANLTVLADIKNSAQKPWKVRKKMEPTSRLI
jgi:hypothetical protein